eukprot:s5250_g2.t1
MKRKAFEFDAGLPWDLHGYIIRMQIYVRDQLTKNELQLFHLQLHPRDSIDTAKYMLSMQLWERHGKFPKLSSFQLEQSGKRLRFTDPVTSAQMLTPVVFVRTQM